MTWTLPENKYSDVLHAMLPYSIIGKVTKSLGLIFEAHLPGASVGSLCRIFLNTDDESRYVDAEVIGFKDSKVILMPFENAAGVNNESRIKLLHRQSQVVVGNFMLGRVVDALGRPMDHKGPLFEERTPYHTRSLYEKPSDPLTRTMIEEPLDLGVKAINGLLTIGKGQRVGIMAGSGVGKSVLLGMLAKNSKSDINVIALIGERNREVREFIERDLGPEGLARSIVVVATGESSPLVRTRAAFLATSLAEYFRDQGKDVLLMMDSVTRFCMAQREIGLSLGEPPASKGYTPSVFSLLPKLLERAGTAPVRGSITGIYTVLVEGDDMDEPIADAARSILDGHIVLSRKLAHRNQFPAIDVLQSTSRVMPAVTSDVQRQAAGTIRELLATYTQNEDLISLGAYVKGSNLKIDQSIAVHDRIIDFIRQNSKVSVSLNDTFAQMVGICRAAEALTQIPQPAKKS